MIPPLRSPLRAGLAALVGRRGLAASALQVTGAALVALGCGLIFLPAGLIAAGVALLAFGLAEEVGAAMLGKLLRRDQPLGTVRPGTALFDVLTGGVGGLASFAGPNVNSDSAMRIGAVMACVRLIAETIAALPRKIYRRTADAREEIRLPADRYLWGPPNETMLGQFFWENICAHLLLTGNAYLYTPRNGFDKVTELWPVAPARVEPVYVDQDALAPPAVAYVIGGVALRPDELLHIPGFGTDGIKGLNPIAYARQSLGLALAQEEYGARFYGQGAALSGLLTTDQRLPPETVERLNAAWTRAHSGRQNAFKTAILEGGLKWTATAVSPADAQYLDGREFSRSEIASLFRVPPHLIGDVEKSTSWGTGIAEQNLQFVTYTLLPWLARIEEAVTDRLLSQPDRFFKFDLRGLLRGTMKERYDAYMVGRNGGWFSVNDVRLMEDMVPVADGDGRIQPLNFAPLGTEPAAAAAGAGDTAGATTGGMGNGTTGQ